MYGYGYRYNSGLVVGAGGGAPFVNTYSLDFDGVDGYVSTSSKIIASDITLSGWVNFNGSYSSFTGHFPLSITPSNISAPNETLGRFYKDGSTLQIAMQGNDNTGANFSTYYVDNTTLEGAGWQHICLTYNVTTKHIYAYLNGVAQNWVKIFAASTPVPFLTAVGTRIYESDLTIGRVEPASSTGTFLGLVDEVSTYNRILTQAEITSISSAPTDLTDLSPIAWYRNGDNGAYKSPQWLIPSNENKDKVSNYSFEFDGVDDDFTSGDLSSLVDNKSKLSISFWVNLPNASEINRITGKYGGSLTKWIAVTCTSNKVSFVVSNIGSTLAFAETNAVLTDNTWHHVVCVFDGTQATATDRIKIYIDNTNETFGFNGTLPTSTYDFTLEPTNPTWYVAQSGLQLGSNELRGKLDEYAIYSDVSLTPSEVSDIYNGGTPNDLNTLSFTPDLWFRMGEEATFSGGVWTVPDSVGSNNGTSNAMTIEDRVSDAPNSENNAVSFNMDEVDRVTDVPT
jgi:hypothetical protein